MAVTSTAYTQENLTALEEAIASGATRVQYAEKSVTYRSLGEMQRIRRNMREALGLAPKSRRRAVASFRSGTK